MVNNNKIGVMVIGGGFVSEGHLNYFQNQQRTNLVAMADPSEEVRKRVGQSYPDALMIADYQEALKRDDIHLVVVCTPHDLHFPMVKNCLEAGKDVICEKPIAITVSEADGMMDCARENGRHFFVSLNMRYSPRVAKMGQLIKDNQLGRIFMARASYMGYEVERLSDPKNWKCDLKRAGGGVLLDGGYHVVDLLNCCLGQARTVQATGGRYVIDAPNKGEDNIALLIEYSQGVLANLYASFTVMNTGCLKEPTLKLELDLFGTEGTALSSYNSPDRRESFELIADAGQRSMEMDVPCPIMGDDFLDCIQKGTEPLVSALDSRNALAVVEAAYKSMKSGNREDVDWRE